MDETHEDLFSGQHNQNQMTPGDQRQRLSGGMTVRERRYMRERRRARTHTSLLADSGAGNLRIAVLRPLLAESVTLEVEHKWRVLFPDALEVDEVDEVDVVDVEAAEGPDLAQDVGDTDDATW